MPIPTIPFMQLAATFPFVESDLEQRDINEWESFFTDARLCGIFEPTPWTTPQVLACAVLRARGKPTSVAAYYMNRSTEDVTRKLDADLHLYLDLPAFRELFLHACARAQNLRDFVLICAKRTTLEIAFPVEVTLTMLAYRLTFDDSGLERVDPPQLHDCAMGTTRLTYVLDPPVWQTMEIIVASVLHARKKPTHVATHYLYRTSFDIECAVRRGIAEVDGNAQIREFFLHLYLRTQNLHEFVTACLRGIRAKEAL